MFSHATTGSRKRAVTGAPRPRRRRSRLHTGTRFQTTIRPGAGSTFPRWRQSWTTQEWERGRRIGRGSDPIRPFSFGRAERDGTVRTGRVARKFRGTETVKVDGKGRMSVPARLRRVFDAGDPQFANGNTGRTQIVAVYGPDDWNWIELYTIDAIDEIDEQIDRLTRGSPERRWLETLMNGQSTDLEIDKEGRLVLPQRLREKLGLTENTETVFESRGDYVQVYHPESRPLDSLALEQFTDQHGPGFDPRAFLAQAGEG
ncbi:MAG: cell division/cell wall cluster transcriptional repressor MraZ [Paracoccus sp. (in: a-proteobacteria)]|nr:cell division/cell wall cluster transcriptional repressor MraZ [Paracoccus sp. (in: a-proteobacteria)]